MENDARHGKRGESMKNDARARRKKENRDQVACIGVATGIRSNKMQKTANKAKSTF